jgi:hypothetical protein
VVDIPSWQLSSATPYGYSESTVFGDLIVGSSYKFEIFVYGTSLLNNLVVGAEVVIPNATSISSVIRSDARHVTINSATLKYSYLISGTVTRIQSQTGISVRVLDAYGETAGSALTLTGKAYITLVGAIK